MQFSVWFLMWFPMPKYRKFEGLSDGSFIMYIPSTQYEMTHSG